MSAVCTHPRTTVEVWVDGPEVHRVTVCAVCFIELSVEVSA